MAKETARKKANAGSEQSSWPTSPGAARREAAKLAAAEYAAPSTPRDVQAQILELEQHNAALVVTLDKKNAELVALKDELEESLSTQVAKGSTAEIYTSRNEELREGRIIDLAKKMRTISMALEREKTVNSQLQQKLKTLVSQNMADLAQLDASKDVQERQRLMQQYSTEIKGLKEKIVQLTRKLEDERLTAQVLRVDLRNTQKALSQEIGDDIPVNKLLEQGSGWKGRAQQIALLKEKVRSLTQRLNSSSNGQQPLQQKNIGETIDESLGIREDGSVGASIGSFTNCDSSMSFMMSDQRLSNDAHGGVQNDSLEGKQRAYIKKLGGDRQKELDAALVECETLRKEHVELKRRHDGHAARNRILESDVKSLKEKLTMVVEKTNNGDKLIELLQRDNELLKNGRHRSGRGSTSQQQDKDLVISHKLQESKIVAQEKLITHLENELAKKPSFVMDRRSNTIPSLTEFVNEQQQAQDNINQQQQQVLNAQMVEFDKLRELRTIQSEEIKELRYTLAERDIQLKNERRARTIQVHNATALQKQQRVGSPTASGLQNQLRTKKDGPHHVIPPSEREIYEAEITRLKSKVTLLKDEVQVLKGTIGSINDGKEREIAYYCQMVSDVKRAASTIRLENDSITSVPIIPL